MKSFKALSLLLLAGVVSAQYNYSPPPTTPRGTYLPPKNEQEEQVGPQGLTPDAEHEPGMPFDFTYAVKDDVGNDFSHNAESNGDVVKGEYRILLPDSRVQVVRYTADWKNGYNAEVSFEGEAVYPEEAPKKPAPPPRPATQKPFKPESEFNNDSQGLGPPAKPTEGYNYAKPTTRPPPRTTRPPPPRTTRPPPPPPRTQPPPPRTTRPTTPPPPPPGLYGAPSVPFGVRNNPKFGYSK